ncbi:conserved protein of unknown function [Thermococcus nautili]|uniref:hypothetical protein n=1 Tax=Thermococcus nautili TaxID=195522 RepID=UPI0025521BBB|nr:hypothetical protein [Thermococcus nautili]CAI1492306.1 conserved protein of unknown function [Thermococcus nautili]
MMDYRDVLREMLLAWRTSNVVELAVSNEGAFSSLMVLLRDGDDRVRRRALIALREILRRKPEPRYTLSVLRNLRTVLSLLKDTDEVAIEALRLLAVLFSLVHPEERDYVEVVDALVSLVRSKRNEVVLLEIPPVLERLRPAKASSLARSRAMALLSSGNPRLRAMGLRLLANMSVGDSRVLSLLLDEIDEALLGEDVPLQDFTLNLLSEVLVPPSEENVGKYWELLRALEVVSHRSPVPGVRSKARDLAFRVKKLLTLYYSSRPGEAMRTIAELLAEGKVDEAMELALEVGEDVPRGFSKLPSRGGSVVLGPKYVEHPRGSGPGGGSSSWGAVRKKKPEPPEKPETRVPFERVAELVDALSGSIEEKMDALWELHRLAKELPEKGLVALEPAVEPLLGVLASENRWARDRSARILARLALRAPYGAKIVSSIMGLLERRKAVPGALTFLSYYFSRRWDGELAGRVLPLLRALLKEYPFEVLLTLEAMTRTVPREDAVIFAQFVPLLKEIKRTELAPIALRVLENIAEKERSLVL